MLDQKSASFELAGEVSYQEVFEVVGEEKANQVDNYARLKCFI